MSVRFIDLKSQYEQLKTKIDAQIHKVLEHGQYILGPEVEECERKLAEFTGAKFVLSCSNGTDALVIALMALGIEEGDEVIVPGFSFFATAEVVSFLKAKPVFVDVERDTALIDVDKIEAAITSRTKVIIPVGLFGQLASMTKINEIADRHGLKVIEDGAQSFGAILDGKRSCNHAFIGCTSFFPAKPLGCYGDGGAIFTNDPEIYEVMRRIRMHGEATRYNHTHIGMNARMDTIQCAILIPKLENFPWEIEQRKKVAKLYSELFLGMSDFVRPIKIHSDRDSVYAQYTLIVKDRDSLKDYLASKNIPTAIHYPKPMYAQPAYSEIYSDVKLENCDFLAQSVLSLPMHPYLEEGLQKEIASHIFEFYKN